MLVGIGLLLSAAIMAYGIAQALVYGDLPPFAVKPPSDKLSLGETGDFIGGWANSIALIWLVVVTGLQYQALNVQQAELKSTRQEMADTRAEFQAQVKLMEEQRKLLAQQVQLMSAQTDLVRVQTETSQGMLDLERGRTAIDFLLTARLRLRELLIEVLIPRAVDSSDRRAIPDENIRALIDRLERLYRLAIRTDHSEEQRRSDIIRFAEDTSEILNLFDAADHYKSYLTDMTLYKSLQELREHKLIYQRCKEAAEKAEKARRSV